VFLGATTIRPGTPNITGTLVAVAFLAVSTSGLALLGTPAYVESIFYGAALIVAVSASLLTRRRRSGR
jgi:ribose transport system permease protein